MKASNEEVLRHQDAFDQTANEPGVLPTTILHNWCTEVHDYPCADPKCVSGHSANFILQIQREVEDRIHVVVAYSGTAGYVLTLGGPDGPTVEPEYSHSEIHVYATREQLTELRDDLNSCLALMP